MDVKMIGKTLIIIITMLLLNACTPDAPKIPGKASTKIFDATKEEVLSAIKVSFLGTDSAIKSSSQSSIVVDQKVTGSTARMKYDVVDGDGYVILYAQVFKIENYGTEKEKTTTIPEDRDLDMLLYKIKRNVRR